MFYTLLACFLAVSCSKIESSAIDDLEEESSKTIGYNLLTIDSNSKLTSKIINIDGERVTVTNGAFSEITLPNLSYRQGKEVTFYIKKSNCSSAIIIHDFEKNDTKNIDVFKDDSNCDVTSTSIASLNNTIFIGYVNSKTSIYAIRVIDEPKSSGMDFNDIILGDMPISMAIANNRLFVLTLDVGNNENKLVTIELENRTTISEINLASEAKDVFLNYNEDIIISYENWHTTINSATLAFVNTNYQSGKETEFVASELNHFDEEGKLYYPRVSGSYSDYPIIPVMYDFSNDLLTLYLYENFLTETQRTLEYAIETTSMVGYDDVNDYIIIGYKKNNNSNSKGGIFRIATRPELKFVDNIDLDAVPTYFFMK